MSQRYALARLGALAETLPELLERINTLGERFERANHAAGYAISPYPPGSVATSAALFERSYSIAAQAHMQATERGTVPPNELIAIEELVLRAEQAEAMFEQATRGPNGGTLRTTRASIGDGGLALLLVGVVVLAGVLYLTRGD